MLWFIWCLVNEVIVGTRCRDPLLAAIAMGSAGAIVSMLVHSMVDFNLQIPSNALAFLIMVVLVSGIDDRVRRGSKESVEKAR